MESRKRTVRDNEQRIAKKIHIHSKRVLTDFDNWTNVELEAFLTRRGEDVERNLDRVSLIERAWECEVNTGPANKTEISVKPQEEVDPLDAYMAELQDEVQSQQLKPVTVKVDQRMECDEAADPAAEYMQVQKEQGLSSGALAALKVGTKYDSDEEVYAAAKAADEDLEAEYDSEDQLIIKKRDIGALPALDHDQIEYDGFEKNFYKPSATILNKSQQEVTRSRDEHSIKIGGFDAPVPIDSFFQCGFDLSLLSVIKKQNYETPTPIQMQTIPVALSGRDVVGIAKTGSGKTAAYLLPLCVHVMAAPALKRGEGPLAIVLAPTRELSEQIHKQARIFTKPYDMSVVACFGGLRKYDQIKALKSGSDIIIATPGRLIDLIKAKACSMRKCTFVVVDEADRMFDMGFETQLRSIIGQIRPDRQTLLFSATMPTKVERLARDVLTNPIRISIGRSGAVNEDIQQKVETVANDMMKYLWLSNNLPALVDAGEVLIFANQIARVEEITLKLKESGFRAAGIHGDMDQQSRMQILQDFRNEMHHVLVATDVAARGLDIKNLRTVINFDCAKDIDGHVHRVGRTGRAGDKDGIAFTLVTPKETKQAAFLVNSLTAAGQEVTEALHNFATKVSKHGARGKKGAKQVGGAGLGFSEIKADPNQIPMSEFAPADADAPVIIHPPKAVTQSIRTPSTISVSQASFVSSGVQDVDSDDDATVIAPKRTVNVALPPPPVPVTELPLYATPRPPLPINRIHNTVGEDSAAKEQYKEALAVAQEIAARFGGKASKP